MGTEYIAASGEKFEDEDVGVIAATIGLGMDAQIIFSYSMSGGQLLNAVASKFQVLRSSYGMFHTHIENSSFFIDELGQVGPAFHVIESPEDGFAAVILSFCPVRSDDFDEQAWEVYTRCVATMMVNARPEYLRLPDCASAKLRIETEKRTKPFDFVGFYFPNSKLADIFRHSKEIRLPYDTLLPVGTQRKIPAWYGEFRCPSEDSTNSSGGGGGCYVATAVYGSYDCPEVWTLRRFRDFALAETWYGRAFIKMYYAVSPTLVKWFGQTVWFNKFWRGPLDKFVSRLKSAGYDDSPYND